MYASLRSVEIEAERADEKPEAIFCAALQDERAALFSRAPMPIGEFHEKLR